MSRSDTKMTTLRIATRKSALALAQTDLVAQALTKANPDVVCSVVSLQTTGDKITQHPLAEIGGKGLFTKELDDALLNDKVDIAVHSSKDIPATYPDGLVLAAVLKRENPFDAFISTKYQSIRDLPQGATIGTSSIRRSIQLTKLRPDLKIVPYRGNIHTRLQKLDQVDGSILAVAGLKRAGLESHIKYIFNHDEMLPAVAQGAIGIFCRKNDPRSKALLDTINDPHTMHCIQAERSFLQHLDGSCKTPLAALATLNDDQITLDAFLATEDGSQISRTQVSGSVEQASELGIQAAQTLKNDIG